MAAPSLWISALDRPTFPSSSDPLKCPRRALFIRQDECCVRINAPRKTGALRDENQHRASFDGVRLSTRLSSYSTALVASGQLARSEGIKRNAPVTLCVSADGAGCSTSGQWETGWIVVSGTKVLLQQPAAAGGYQLRDTGGASALTFQATGVGASPASIMTICRASPAPAIPAWSTSAPRAAPASSAWLMEPAPSKSELQIVVQSFHM